MGRLKNLIEFLKSDAYRYIGNSSVLSRIMLYIKSAGYNYSCKMRFVKYCNDGKLTKILFPIAYLRYRRAMIRYGISIPYKTEIGYGLYIGHFGGIVINSECKIGNNVNISQGVTIGQAGENGNKQCPVIEDCVYIGPKATIVGGVTIHEHASIGANSFVNKNVDSHTTVGGVPAKVISYKGSVEYIHNIYFKHQTE